jgi:hypothetical protein
VSNFKRHFLSCLFLFKKAYLQNIDFSDAILDPTKIKEILGMIQEECQQQGTGLPFQGIINRDL